MYVASAAFIIVDCVLHGSSPPRQYVRSLTPSLTTNIHLTEKVPLPTNPIQVAMLLYDACLYVVASIGFLVYGGLYFFPLLLLYPPVT